MDQPQFEIITPGDRERFPGVSHNTSTSTIMQTFVFEQLQTELNNLKEQFTIANDPDRITAEIASITAEIEAAKKKGFRNSNLVYFELQHGCDLEIGNIVRIKSNWGTTHAKIIRKTKTMVISEKGTRFPIHYDSRFRSIPFDVWDSVQYTAFAAYNPKCKECGQRFDVNETGRIFGKQFIENHPGFCSAHCYTKHTIKP